MDGDGEAIQARRRAAAVEISHLTPMLGRSGVQDRFKNLDNALHRWEETHESSPIEDLLPEWGAAVFEGRAAEIPESVKSPLREKAIRSIDEARSWLSRLQASPERELAMLLRVLHGEFLPSGPVGDPLAMPDALPSGRNLHQGDPRLIPTKEAWEVGKKLAHQLIERHRKHHGKYPERISMILWQGETGRHQGAMEAQALYLMGIQPEWNTRGFVDGLKLIPDEELGRPRVNVLFTASGLYRDGMADKIILLDRAARLAASAGDNPLSRQNREVKQTLLANGVSEEDADEFAGARVFTEAPGAYGFGLSNFVEQSRDKDEPDTMAQLYLRKMNFVYSEKTWGRSVPKLLESQLRGNEAILHSASSNLYGAVDNDDVYQWMGGLRVASQAAGAKPELFINNMRRAGDEKIEEARHFIAAELNSRNWNPQWISEMQKEGYSGARVMMNSVEYLYGWQATAPESISPMVWQKTYDIYVADEYGLGMNRFFETANPAAKQVLVARLLEVDRQGTYPFTAAERTRLITDYVRLVNRFGVACSANVCGNPRLQSAVLAEARKFPLGDIKQRELDQFERRFQDAARRSSISKSPATFQTSDIRAAKPFSIFKVSAEQFANLGSAAKRIIEENLRLLSAIGFVIIVLGSLVAYGKRRPVEWSELHLEQEK